MDNPFLRRATEYLRDDEAFLSVVSPEPVNSFLREPGRNGQLYDQLVVLRGTPGSGKTTMARLFEYPTIGALLRNRNINSYQPLAASLADCGAISGGTPTIVGYRLPLESDYRDCWEFPYPDELKLKLMIALIQARAVLGWVRNLTAGGVQIKYVEMVPRPDADAAVMAVGGTQAINMVERARAVEASLYKVVAALVPPAVSELDPDSTEAYRPFDVVDRFRVVLNPDDEGPPVELRPLVMLDDAHTLHPAQFRGLQRWLSRRELRVGRWVLTRLDSLQPQEILAAPKEPRGDGPQLPGLTAARDVIEIMLQSSAVQRRGQRLAFRKMAKDMADRYLRQMPLFSSRNLSTFSDLLATEAEGLSVSKRKQLLSTVDGAQQKLLISDTRRRSLSEEVDRYQPRVGPLPDDVRLAMLSVLMYRYVKRSPQMSLLGPDSDPDPSKPLVADASVYDAARIHLLHWYGRPYYFGIDDLCDAGSENAEQFLHLSAILVDAAAAQLVRNKRAVLSASLQHKLLQQKASEIVNSWDFPDCRAVRRLADAVGRKCVEVSLEPNGWLGAGANAYGVPQEDFDQIPDKNPDLAHVLQYGIAYNAFSIVPSYPCKGREWCILELGGLLILHHGLTLKRGGFLEGSVSELGKMPAGTDE